MEGKSGKHTWYKWFLSGVIATLLAVALLYFVFMLIPVGGAPSHPDTIQTIRKAKEIERIVGKNYLGEIDEQMQTDSMFAGQLAGLGDPYSRYYTQDEYEQIKNMRAGEYVGIGITFYQSAEDGSMIISDVQKNSPAEEAGLQEDDAVFLINGTDAAALTTSELREMIQKSAGKEITMLVRRRDDEIEVTLIPEQMELETATGYMLDKTTGYIRISQFSSVTPDQYRSVYQELKEKGMSRMILDLRNNTGGLVESACTIAEQILPEGIIVYEEDRDGRRKYHNGAGAEDFSCSLAVLINEQTASASEILAGAIQDYGVGTLVGVKSFGKGIVQNVFRLSDGSVIQLTTTHYYTPDGNDIHEKGIQPDVEVQEDTKTGKDEQLLRAQEVLS